MPPPHALASRERDARAEAASDPAGDDPSAIHLVPVPRHWAPAGWPPASNAPQDDGAATVQVLVAEPADDGRAWLRQFAVLLAETLAGVRPARQILPWLSGRGALHLHRLLPLFADGHRPHVTRVLSTRPARDVIEMTLVVTVGPRTRGLAVRLERTDEARRSDPSARWRCTDIEAA